MISPMVSPSQGTGSHGLPGPCTVDAFLHVVAHALAAVEAQRCSSSGSSSHSGVLGADRGRAVGFGQAVDVGDVEADLLHALDHRGRRRRRRRPGR